MDSGTLHQIKQLYEVEKLSQRQIATQWESPARRYYGFSGKTKEKREISFEIII